jgi:hypothetical protein
MISDRKAAISVLEKWKDEPCFVYLVFRPRDGRNSFSLICLVTKVSDVEVELKCANDALVGVTLRVDKADFKYGDEREVSTLGLPELEGRTFSSFLSIRLITGGDCFLGECSW